MLRRAIRFFRRRGRPGLFWGGTRLRERLANRHKTPTEEKIRAFTGEEAFDRMALITGTLSALFRIKRKLLFLRGGDSCWG